MIHRITNSTRNATAQKMCAHMHLIEGKKLNSSKTGELAFFSLCQSKTKSHNKCQLGYYIPESLRVCVCMRVGVYVSAWEWERGIERVDRWKDCQENKAEGGRVSRSRLFFGMWSTEKSCLGLGGESPGMNQQECDFIFPLSHFKGKKKSLGMKDCLPHWKQYYLEKMHSKMPERFH